MWFLIEEMYIKVEEEYYLFEYTDTVYRICKF